MLNTLKDAASQFIKTIVDYNRCNLCDKLDGARMRFVCGHTACLDCVAVCVDCSICSPSMDTSSNLPRSDSPLTRRVQHATELLTTFQDAFETDVYQRQRISDRLKVERELFPECIQAPSKYFNKRKSLNVSSKHKENRLTIFPGEEVSSKREITMNKTSYVQEWLNKQTSSHRAPSRSPFSDLQVNTLHKSSVKGKEKFDILNQSTQLSRRKSSRLKKSLLRNVQSSLETYLTPVEKCQSKKMCVSAKRLKQDLGVKTKGPGKEKLQEKSNCEESGIVVDDDCFTIEDSQTQIMDKDRLALRAVADADLKSTTSSSVAEVEDSQVIHDINWEKETTPPDTVQKNQHNVVHFYKKCYLFKNCTQCIDNDHMNKIKPKLQCDSLKNDTDIAITVENKSFITTITVVDCHQSSSDKKQSISVQTVEEPFLGFEQTTQKEETVTMISKIKEYIQSEAMFTEGIVSDTDAQKTSCTNVVLIENKPESNLVEGDVVADQHTEYGYGILTECGAGSQNRKRKPLRGVTPDSNNSSDKENCDPNRKKKDNGKKKKKTSK